MDVRADLEDALTTPLKPLAFSATFDSSPNPTLRLDSLNTIGLPLSEREARLLISRCSRPSTRPGADDSDVNIPWTMESTKIQFDNPAWFGFIDRAMHAVCEGLGVHVGMSNPRCELDMLVVHEADARPIRHTEHPRRPGAFAAMLVVLPTSYAGGERRISHGVRSRLYDLIRSSRLAASVLSWYAGVAHDIAPLTSGFRLALSYSIVHTAASVCPGLAVNDDVSVKLHHVFHAWAEDPAHAPEKIVHLLKEKYYRGRELSTASLTGEDAHKLQDLAPIARQYGFRLGLATVICCVAGPAKIVSELGWCEECGDTGCEFCRDGDLGYTPEDVEMTAETHRH